MVTQVLRTPLVLGALAAFFTPDASALPDDPARQIDLADLTAGIDFTRINGPGQDLGDRGVPVCAGGDIDGDGNEDFAVGHFLADPLGRTDAGEVNIVFGNGQLNDNIDLAVNHPRVLRIIGSGNLGAREGAGSEIWQGDVTGDGLHDLLICRQNYSINSGGSRLGAGSLVVIVGSPMLATLAASNTTIDLANPPASVTVFDIVGPHSNSRLGIWARVGDVDGDGIDDALVAADQENSVGTHAGAAYVIRGGAHLNQNAQVDLANYGSTILAGNIARIIPPAGSNHFHLGSTNQTGDLDGNGRHEVLLSAALNRSGAVVGPTGDGGSSTHASGGADPNGWCFVVWDDNFPVAPWPNGFVINMGAPVGSLTTVRGGNQNDTFGEELLGGLDYNNDGLAELFIGDLTGDGTGGSRPTSGVGYVIYGAQAIKGLTFNIDNAAGLGIQVTKILGPSPGAIGADTVAQGDYNGDGHGDLLFGSPTDNPLGRSGAGSLQLFYGGTQWPATIDTAPNAFPSPTTMLITELLGAEGSGGGGSGDTLCYSASAGDIDGDGRQDIVVNEMRGDGILGGTDAGNLVILSGADAAPIFESLTIDIPGPIPTTLDPAGDSLAVTITEGAPGDLMGGSELLHYDTGGGFNPVALTNNGGGSYTATFPAIACGSPVSWYISAETVSGLVFTNPDGAPNASYSSVSAGGVTNFASYDMESTSGWVGGLPGDTATTGVWVRGDPIGTNAQPENDHTPVGSDCWFTGQGSPSGSVGEADVDGGSTTLLSPIIDLASATDPTVRYVRWYSNDQGNSPNADIFRIDISDDGGSSWASVEVVGPSGAGTSGGWIQYTFRVLDIAGVSLTSQMQMRFIASDLGDGSIVEAAIDDFSIDDITCDTGIGTPYCQVQINSVGLMGRLTATGSNTASDNDVTLEASQLPPNQFGYFLASEMQGFIPFPGTSSGNFCLGQPTARFSSQVQNSGATGEFSVMIDLSNIPLTPPVAVVAGETWNFQGWYRDFTAFPTSNFTNGYEVVFD